MRLFAVSESLGYFSFPEAEKASADLGLISAQKGTAPSPSLEVGLKAQLIADKATECLKAAQLVKFVT